MLVFPNGKINLGLRILRKREDGFHELETVFYPVAIRDVLEVIGDAGRNTGYEKREKQQERIQFSMSGMEFTGVPENNLCIKAYELLEKELPQLPAIQMHLHKAIPQGAGLGGGSSDGAYTLKLLSAKSQLGLSVEKLLDYALRLGSDCPFFIINKPCLATGRGEILRTISLDLSRYCIVIVYPGIHIDTAGAFLQLNVSDTLKTSDTLSIIQKPIETWKKNLVNDFEEPVFEKYAEIASIKKELYEHGAIYASLTGSGSTVYGIFPKVPDIKKIFPAHYYLKVI